MWEELLERSKTMRVTTGASFKKFKQLNAAQSAQQAGNVYSCRSDMMSS